MLRPKLVALLGLIAAAPADELQFSRDDLGLRLRRPDASWVVHVADGQPASALASVVLYRPSSSGVPSVTIYVARHDGQATAEQVREKGIAKLEAQGGTVLERSEATLVGRPAARVRGRMTGADGQDYEARLDYAVAPPLVYAVQSVWRAGEDFPEALLRPLLDSIELVQPVERPPPDAATLELQRLAARCGSALPWAEDWEAAAARARAEDRVVLVVFEHFTGIEVPHTRASGALMDTDVEALLQERGVVLRLEHGDDAPFRDADVWGMGRHSWGGSFLVVSPEGEVLAQTALNSGLLLDELLRGALDRRAARPGGAAGDRPARPAGETERLDAAALALRRGELSRAGELLAEAGSPRGHRVRAALGLRERRGEDALAELEAARPGADDVLLADVAVERAVVLLRLGRWADAEAALRESLERFPEGARAPEARFWLGAVEMLQQGFPTGREQWRALASERPDDRWAWKAAANVLDGGAFVNGAERPHWPSPGVLAALERGKAAPLPASRVQQAARDALAYLIASQQPDGSWVAPMDALGVQPSGYTFATTALCGSSLLPHRAADDAVELALRRAVHYLLAVEAAGGFEGGTSLMGVYSIWSRAFALRFLAQARAAGLAGDGEGDVAALDAALPTLLRSVLDSQQRSGGWPYVLVSGTSSTQGFDGSASFLTAGVIVALIDARASGLEVPQAPLDRALDFLAGMRQPDGAFRYFAGVPEAPGDPEAAGRGPVCELALLRGGRGGLPALSRALDAFDGQRATLRREWGKDLCHTGEQGQGAHYLLYDWSFAALATTQLPRRERSRWRRELLGDLLAVRDAEGAYADMPSLGRAYGTAMALAAFDALAHR